MKLSVYLGENEIRTVLGRTGKKIEIQDCCRIRLKEGALINDIVTEEDAVREVLNRIRDRCRKHRRQVYLTMGGNQIITRVLKVPRLPHKQMVELVRRELSDLILPSEERNYVYDYSVIRKEKGERKGRTILCVAMKREVIEEYEALFSDCGLKLKAIDVAQDGLNRLVDFLPDFCDKNFILTVVDGRNMMTALYIDGVYTYTNRMRLVEERGAPESAEEMAKVIRSVIHFCRMQKEEFELDFVSLCGLEKEELDILIPDILRNEKIAVNVPEAEDCIIAGEGLDYSMDQFMYVTGNLLRGRSSLNLITAARYRESDGEAKRYRKTAAWLLPAAVITAFLGTAVRNEVSVREMREEIRILEERRLERVEVRDTAGENQLKEKLAALNEWLAGREAVKREAGKRPQMNSSVRERILAETSAGMELSEPEYSAGEVTFYGRSPEYEEISAYVHRLEESGLFSEVEYSGFTNRNPATGEQDGGYYFRLVCRLKIPD